MGNPAGNPENGLMEVGVSTGLSHCPAVARQWGGGLSRAGGAAPTSRRRSRPVAEVGRDDPRASPSSEPGQAAECADGEQPSTPSPGRARRIARRVLIALCVLGLLLAAAWVALQRAYPPGGLARCSPEDVTAATGRAFRIDGDAHAPPAASAHDRCHRGRARQCRMGPEPDMLRARHVGFEIDLRDLAVGHRAHPQRRHRGR